MKTKGSETAAVPPTDARRVLLRERVERRAAVALQYFVCLRQAHTAPESAAMLRFRVSYLRA
jgi:hypothetical protein